MVHITRLLVSFDPACYPRNNDIDSPVPRTNICVISSIIILYYACICINLLADNDSLESKSHHPHCEHRLHGDLHYGELVKCFLRPALRPRDFDLSVREIMCVFVLRSSCVILTTQHRKNRAV